MRKASVSLPVSLWGDPVTGRSVEPDVSKPLFRQLFPLLHETTWQKTFVQIFYRRIVHSETAVRSDKEALLGKGG